MAVVTPRQLSLFETDSELLLTIPASQKERAKRIEGRRWDPDRVCWVYPKTQRVFDAIIAEFGDDLDDTKVVRPEPDQKAAAQAAMAQKQLAADNERLRGELAGLRETLGLLKATGKQGSTQVERLHALLEKRESQLEKVQDRLAKTQERADSLVKAIDASKKENAKLRIELEGARSSSSVDGRLTARLQTLAIQGSSGSAEFAAALKSVKTTSRYPVDLALALERHLRASLKNDDPASLHDLIVQADEAGLLTPEAVDLAHALRRQRNTAVHSTPDEKAMRARALLSLFTAALLWRELSGGT
ncbi:MAG: hypothetical protein JXB46_11205 [Candidatus Eisenbacteria bacterium]|nr:hypothetical protein [Candidatus Eisenbacteria bacterium]